MLHSHGAGHESAGGTRRIGLREQPGDSLPAGFLSASRTEAEPLAIGRG